MLGGRPSNELRVAVKKVTTGKVVGLMEITVSTVITKTRHTVLVTPTVNTRGQIMIFETLICL